MKITDFCTLTPKESWLLGLIPLDHRTEIKESRQPLHLILVIDESYSMYYDLPRVIEDCKKQVRRLQPGDALTFGWFSSEGMSGFPIKGSFIANEKTFEIFDRLFDGHKRARAMTCFSESLAGVEKLLVETAFLKMRNCLMFFSDGYANDPGVQSERQLVTEIMEGLNRKVDQVLTISYGDYADKDFLTRMAQIAGGTCIASAYLEECSAALHQFICRSQTSEPKIKVSLEGVPFNFVFAVDNNPETGGVIVYQPDENGELLISLSAGIENLYVLSSAGDGFYRSVIGQGSNPKFDLQDDLRKSVRGQLTEKLLEGAYAASVVLSQNGRQDEAIEVLGYLGDKGLVERLGSAYTPTERGNAENEIRHSVFNPPARYRQGIDFGCVPRPDQFCQLDLLKLLAEDPEAKFHPRHPDFKYKKIGRSETVRYGYPDFMPEPGASGPFSDVILNKEFLNLSIRVKIQGSIQLPESVTVDEKGKLSPNGLTTLKRPETLPEVFKCHQYRMYTLVKDGFPNVTRLPVTCSPETALKLQELGVWVWNGQNYLENAPFSTLHLDKLPIINKITADNILTAAALAEKLVRDESLKSTLKVLNHLRNEIDPNREIVKRNDWTINELKFLKALGLTDEGAYTPPTDRDAPTDQYEVTAFKTSIKGFSSLPSVDEVRERMKNGRKLTTAMVPMAKWLETASAAISLIKTEDKLLWLDQEIADVKREQRNLRSEIQKAKFAMVLGHRWFPDVPPTGEALTLQVDSLFNPDEQLTATIQITKAVVKI